MKDKYYRIFHNGRLMAYGTASCWQAKDWRKMGYNIVEAIA